MFRLQDDVIVQVHTLAETNSLGEGILSLCVHRNERFISQRLSLLNPTDAEAILSSKASLTHLQSEFVWYSHTFENNLGIMQKVSKYLKESCSMASD